MNRRDKSRTTWVDSTQVSMKLFLSLSLFGVLCTSTLGADVDTRRHVEVDATAEILVEPDYATWSIKIRGEAESVAEASQRLEESTAALKASLVDSGFEGEIIRFSAISSGRHFVGDRDERIFKGYFAERSAVIELRDLGKRQELETILLGDDRIEIDDVSAQSSKHDEYRRRVVLAAAVVAKDKAADLAAALDSELGQVLSIRQGNVQFGFGFVTRNTIRADEGVASAELKKLSYHATVSVKFELK